MGAEPHFATANPNCPEYFAQKKWAAREAARAIEREKLAHLRAVPRDPLRPNCAGQVVRQRRARAPRGPLSDD
jgi:hypothetical protein